MTKYSNLSLESHNISLAGKCTTFQIIQCPPQSFCVWLSDCILLHELLIPAHGLMGETHQYLIQLEGSM